MQSKHAVYSNEIVKKKSTENLLVLVQVGIKKQNGHIETKRMTTFSLNLSRGHHMATQEGNQRIDVTQAVFLKQ